MTVSFAAAADPLKFDCLIRPEMTVTVSAPSAGAVAEVYVDRGDFVKKGQVIAMMEYLGEQAAVASARSRASVISEQRTAEAKLRYETQRLARARKLQAEKNLPDQTVEEVENAKLAAEAALLQARENHEMAELELKRAEASLERRRVRSPINGVVVKRRLNPTEYADPPQVMEIAQIDPLRVDVLAPASALGKIKTGMKGVVTPQEGYTGKLSAEVTIVDRVVDAASGSFGIRLRIPNTDRSIPAGLKCMVQF